MPVSPGSLAEMQKLVTRYTGTRQWQLAVRTDVTIRQGSGKSTQITSTHLDVHSLSQTFILTMENDFYWRFLPAELFVFANKWKQISMAFNRRLNKVC